MTKTALVSINLNDPSSKEFKNFIDYLISKKYTILCRDTNLFNHLSNVYKDSGSVLLYQNLETQMVELNSGEIHILIVDSETIYPSPQNEKSGLLEKICCESLIKSSSDRFTSVIIDPNDISYFKNIIEENDLEMIHSFNRYLSYKVFDILSSVSKPKATTIPFICFNNESSEKVYSYNKCTNLTLAFNIANDISVYVDSPVISSVNYNSILGVGIGNTDLSKKEKEYYITNTNLDAESISSKQIALLRSRLHNIKNCVDDYIGVSCIVDKELAKLIVDQNPIGVISPGYTDGALDILENSNVFIYEVKNDYFSIRSDNLLTSDHIIANKRFSLNSLIPTIVLDPAEEMSNIIAKLVLKYNQGNTVVITNDSMILGINSGPQNIDDSLRIALRKASIYEMLLNDNFSNHYIHLYNESKSFLYNLLMMYKETESSFHILRERSLSLDCKINSNQPDKIDKNFIQKYTNSPSSSPRVLL